FRETLCLSGGEDTGKESCFTVKEAVLSFKRTTVVSCAAQQAVRVINTHEKVVLTQYFAQVLSNILFDSAN
ncbi:hypothetical protein, partial [Enterobacter hormaechei]|uniref:hypothetical protein n=1 Tax=Enterobacter hormaechei TaxID=158836 RepID=UPI00195386E0